MKCHLTNAAFAPSIQLSSLNFGAGTLHGKNWSAYVATYWFQAVADMFHYAVIPEDALMVVRAFGKVTEPGQLRARRESRTDPHFSKVDKMLVDLTDVDDSTISGSGMASQSLALNTEYQSREVPMRYALFAPPGSYGFGIGRMFQNATGLAENMEVRVFETAADACIWLELPQPPDVYLEHPGFAAMR